MLTIDHTFPNGTVNATLSLTFTSASKDIADDIAALVAAELTRRAGTSHVPAIPAPALVFEYAFDLEDGHGPDGTETRIEPHLLCPVCGELDEIVELDVSSRWNRLHPSLDEDGVLAHASVGDGDYESDGFECSACYAKLEAPEGFEITDWS